MNDIYYLTCSTSEDSDISILINGFPIHNGFLSKNNQVPFLINDYLILNSNKISLALLEPSEDIGPRIIEVNISIKNYKGLQYFTPESGDKVNIFEFDDETTSIEKNEIYTIFKLDSVFKKTESKFFHNKSHNFSSLFIGSPLDISDSEITNYGAQLIDFIKTSNTSGFINEYMPKIKLLTKTKAIKEELLISALTDFIKEISDTGLDKDVRKENISIRRWCNNRVFEIFIKPDKPLITTDVMNEEVAQLAIFVSIIDDSLKIVR